MRLGEILVGSGLVTVTDIEAGIQRQLVEGGRLGENLISLGLLTSEQLTTVINGAPTIPSTVVDTGISQRNLLNLMLKLMHLESLQTVPDLADRMKLHSRVVQELLDGATHLHLVQAMGSVPGGAFGIRTHSASKAERRPRRRSTRTSISGQRQCALPPTRIRSGASACRMRC